LIAAVMARTGKGQEPVEVDAAHAAFLDQPLPAKVVPVTTDGHPVEDVRSLEERSQGFHHVLHERVVGPIVVAVRQHHVRRVLDNRVGLDTALMETFAKACRDARVVSGVEEDDGALPARRLGHVEEPGGEGGLVHRWWVNSRCRILGQRGGGATVGRADSGSGQALLLAARFFFCFSTIAAISARRFLAS